jgi:hypothetical protein
MKYGCLKNMVWQRARYALNFEEHVLYVDGVYAGMAVRRHDTWFSNYVGEDPREREDLQSAKEYVEDNAEFAASNSKLRAKVS